VPVDFEEAVGRLGLAVDGLGVGVMVIGLVIALLMYVSRLSRRDRDPQELYRQARVSAGRSILMGLELLVAGDIIRTVAVSPTFRSVGVLAVIVLIRTFLSFTLEMEISGRWPWQTERGRVPQAQPD
jgi:uncharacterized membrane protein